MAIVTLASCTILDACSAPPELPTAQETTSHPIGVTADDEVEDPSGTVQRFRRERDQALRRAAASQNADQPPRARKSTSTGTVLAGATKSFAALSSRLGGSIGVAYVPAGSGGHVTSYGALDSGVGWSTMKVPVAIAVVRSTGGHPSADDRRQMRRAITQSDNAAALLLWSRLGSAKAAAAQTQRVLRDGGDTSTVVPAHRRRPEFTPFGQSEWFLSTQATFAASLPCIAGSGPIVRLMGQVTRDQRWGAGRLEGTVAFKGGWGPGTNGGYLVRQMAILRLANGTRVGVAMAVKPADGRFETGVADLNVVARWLEGNVYAERETGC